MKKFLSILGLVLIVLLVIPATAQALSFRVAQQDQASITVEKDQVIRDNYLVAGNIIDIKGQVTGDLFAFGQNVDVFGKVNGNVFTGASTVRISGSVGGDVYAGGGIVDLSKEAVIEGDLITGAGTVKIDGEVKGKVWAGVGFLTIGETAKIPGEIIYSSDNKAQVKAGAVVGKIVQKVQEKAKEGALWRSKSFNTLMGFLMSLLVGIILISILPKWSLEISQRIKTDLWKSLGWGLVFLIAIPIVIFICLIIIIGMPLAMILFALYLIALYLAKIMAGLALGQYLSKNKWQAIWSLTLGLLIIFALSALPFVGGLISFLAILLGLGAIATNCYLHCRKSTK